MGPDVRLGQLASQLLKAAAQPVQVGRRSSVGWEMPSDDDLDPMGRANRNTLFRAGQTPSSPVFSPMLHGGSPTAQTPRISYMERSGLTRTDSAEKPATWSELGQARGLQYNPVSGAALTAPNLTLGQLWNRYGVQNWDQWDRVRRERPGLARRFGVEPDRSWLDPSGWAANPTQPLPKPFTPTRPEPAGTGGNPFNMAVTDRLPNMARGRQGAYIGNRKVTDQEFDAETQRRAMVSGLRGTERVAGPTQQAISIPPTPKG